MANLPGLTSVSSNKRYFFGIADGRITYRPGKDAPKEEWQSLEAELKGVSKRDAVINEKQMSFYDIALEAHGSDNAVYNYVLSVPVGQANATSIILSLASIPNYHGVMIKFVPWKNEKGFTNVSIYVNGERVKWVVDELPPIKKVMVGMKEINDDSDRLLLVEHYVKTINERLKEYVDPDTGELAQPVVDIDDNDLPGDLG